MKMASRPIDLISQKNKLHVQHSFFSNQQKKRTNLHVQHAFLSLFAVVFCTTAMPFFMTKTSNVLVTHYFYGGIVVWVY